MTTIVCKHSCPIFIETTHMILFDIMLLKLLFWTSTKILELCWQPYMKSIIKTHLLEAFKFPRPKFNNIEFTKWLHKANI